MKNLFLVMMALLMAITTVDAQSKVSRRIYKDAKKEARELKAQGFQLQEPGLLENVIAEYKLKNVKLLTAEVRGKKSINMATLVARNNAVNAYAEKAKTQIKGRITSQATDVAGEEIENLVTGFEHLVLQDMNGELQTAYTLVREAENGFDVKLVYYIDMERLQEIQQESMKKALKQAELTDEYGSKISDWIEEGFEKSSDF